MYAEKKKKKTSRYLKRRTELPVLSSALPKEQGTAEAGCETAEKQI